MSNMSIRVTAGMFLATILYIGIVGMSDLKRSDRIEVLSATEASIGPTVTGTLGRAMPSPALADVPRSFQSAYPSLEHVARDWHAFNRTLDDLTVAIVPGNPLPFHVLTRKDYGGSVTWLGQNDKLPGAMLLTVSNPAGTYDALLFLPGVGEFQVHTDQRGETSISESASGVFACGLGDPGMEVRNTMAGSVSAPAVALSVASSSLQNLETATNESSLARVLSSQTAGPFVDVLVLYDKACLDPEAEFVKPTWRSLNAAPSDMRAFIDGRVRLHLEAANVALVNSQVTNFSWRMAGMEEAPDFVLSGTPTSADYINATIANGKIGPWVTAQAQNYHADQVLFYLGASHSAQPLYVGGVAIGGSGGPVSGAMARAMIRFDQPFTSTAHELAHNFGAAHDRLTDHVPDGNGRYHYGQFWRTDPRVTTITIPGDATKTLYSDGSVVYTQKDGTKTTVWPDSSPGGDTVIGLPRADGSFDVTTSQYAAAGTIMTYCVFRIPHFSNPEVSVRINGSLIGNSGLPYDWGTQPTGVASGDPRAADNARLLVQSAAAMVANSPEPLRPTITAQPASSTYSPGDTFALRVEADDAGLSYQWRKDGVDIPGATSSTYSGVANSSAVGSYSVLVANRVGSVTSSAAEVSLRVSDLLTGDAHSEPSWRTVVHPNGNRYSQVLLTGPAATVRALPGQITRVSFIDLQDDIVQLEFSGAGTLTITLAGAAAPATPEKYNQSVRYVKGHASVIIHGADASTYFSAFSVGPVTAVNSSLFRRDVEYDGHADLARLVIRGPSGQFGGVLLANAAFSDRSGVTGIDASPVTVTGPVRVHDLCAFDNADPILLFGAVTNSDAGVRITGGNMAQNNSRAVRIAGLDRIVMAAGTDSHNRLEPAQVNRATYLRDGIDVTAMVIAPGG